MDGRPGLLTKSARRWVGGATLGVCLGLAGMDARQSDGRQADRILQAQRLEGEAVLALADAALAGRSVPADFEVTWHNEFLKAQRGTFVPFTLTVDLSRLRRSSALVYVRAVPRDPERAAGSNGNRPDRGRKPKEPEYAVDAIFPVELRLEPGQIARISRGFSLAPGEYDIYVVLRERAELSREEGEPRASVLKRVLSVPDFWTGELSTSSVIVADRLSILAEALPPEALSERPYVIGQNDVTPAADRHFRQDEELIVVFLVYNPTVTPERKFDVQVEYHFYRKGAAPMRDAAAGPAVPHPPEQEGERYFNHTEPQRFSPATPGAPADPGSGQPVVAGQGVPLAGFEPGEYRLAIVVTDLLSSRSIVRDVHFSVGS